MTEREFEQRLREWYRARVDDAGAVPHDLQVAVQAIPDISPHRPGFLGMQRRMVILAAAAMLLVLLVGGAIAVGAGLLPWLHDESDITILAPAAWEDQDLSNVEPGTYSLNVPGAGASPRHSTVRVTFTLGAGWERVDVTQLLWGNSKWLNFEVVDNLYADPCHLERGLRRPAIGPSVEDLAGALSAESAWQATAPTEIMLDGYAGKRVQLTAPADSSSCTATEQRLFHVVGGPWHRPAIRDRERLDVWIVDVHGTRVVIIAGSGPRASASDLAQLQAVIDSVKFD
jgi:hypothetical protein